MARIVLFPSPEPSHLTATFGLAKSLRGRGHDVVYLTTADLAGSVERQGLMPRVVLEDVLPRGIQAACRHQAALEVRCTRRMHERIVEGGLDAVLAELRPEVLLVDSWVPSLGFVGYRLGLNVVMLSPTLPRTRDPLVPHASDPLVPDTARRRALCRIRYAGFQLETRARRWLLRKRRRDYGELARASGYPASELDASAGFPRLSAFPELVLCPRELDLPRVHELPGVHYSESFVDTTRHEAVPFDDRWLGRGDPLVYASFGTSTHRSASVARVVAAVAEGLGRCRVPVQGLLAAGGDATSLLCALPRNLVVVEHAPQLAVLRRAALMIHHGGLNSVKECVELAVPMLVVPWAEPVNAVRVAYHGLGELLAADRVSAIAVRDAVERLLDDAGVRARVSAMRRAFQAATSAGLGAAFVEERIAARRSVSG